MNPKLTKKTYKSPEKIWTSPLKGLVTIRRKRTKTVRLKISLFLKTINFKVLKTIRNQVKYLKGLRLPMLL